MPLNGVLPAGVPTMTLDAETQAKVATLPNLQTLFGSLDYCECSSCRSVYSPAAYFVDVLRFLGERGTQGVGRQRRARTCGTCCSNAAPISATSS